MGSTWLASPGLSHQPQDRWHLLMPLMALEEALLFSRAVQVAAAGCPGYGIISALAQLCSERKAAPSDFSLLL